HDLNNVLAPILMAIPILRRHIEDKQIQGFLETVELSAKRGADMVKQVLAFSRGGSGQRISIRLSSLIKEMQKILSGSFPKSVRFQMDVPEDLWSIHGDPTQIHQLLLNLCVNARDAMPEGGALTITASNVNFDDVQSKRYPESKVGPYIILRVSDTGQGIPLEIREKIFDPFFTTKEHGKGTGLGLFTVAGIVKSHGGFIDVYSEIGRGSQFRVYLPAADATEVLQTEKKEVPAGRGEPVLVVAAESSIRLIAKATLDAYGYRALTANNGAEAVALYAQNQAGIGTVVLDMSMNFMDGQQTLHALRKINSGVKVIVSSGTKAYEKIVAEEPETVKSFLYKPYTSEVLLKAVYEAIHGKK
ncbi:MAG: response regulator, partial [Elusimicrobia bacterium]|nr:response regulator [Elusimicrobiota bacterium]